MVTATKRNDSNHNTPRKTLTRQVLKTTTTPTQSTSAATSSRQRRERRGSSGSVAVRNAARRQPDAVPGPVALKPTPASSSSLSAEHARVRVPERLMRPAWKDVNEDALAACGPEMANVPVAYIRDRLKDVGPQMLAAARGERLPAYNHPVLFEVDHDDALPFAPTHLLTVYSKRDWAVDGRRAVRYVPVHDVILAAHCTNLPPLPRGKSLSSITVTSLCLPNITTLDIVLDYLYTQNLTKLLTTLLPRAAVGISAARIPETIAEACSTAELTQRLFLTHALWMNLCALGVHDDALWNILDSVWQVLLSALRMTAEAGTPVNVAPFA